MFGTNLAGCFLPDVKQMVYSLIVKPHICTSRQQNASISLRLPAKLLLSGQWKWLGPPVQQQQLPARPWRLFRGGGAGPALPVLPASAGSLEPHLPGEPELPPPSTTGLVLFNTGLKHQKQGLRVDSWRQADVCAVVSGASTGGAGVCF